MFNVVQIQRSWFDRQNRKTTIAFRNFSLLGAMKSTIYGQYIGYNGTVPASDRQIEIEFLIYKRHGETNEPDFGLHRAKA
jgi:hypothetical protein